ncbi:MAG: transcription termination/antitermination protein NusA [Chloroflexi bacterium]|nr:transcription termination/antitermination protein NusA [Chloroflexota bacterium]
MKSEFLMAVTQLAAERNLPQEMVVEAVEAALASAYRKENATGGQSNVRVHLDPGTGEVEVFQLKTVVEEVENDLAELTIKEAKKLRKGSDPKIDDVLEFEMEPQAAGRIAAQTAKQVVIQRLREAERELIFSEFAEREGEVFTGTVQRGGAYGGVVTLDLNGRATAVLPATEQGMAERYRPGMKMKVMIVEVSRTPRGPEIIVSRTHPDLLRRLFEMEVPEIYNGIVEIRGIAREPGSRSKVAVHAKQDGVDPVGACVGLRGIRIQNIVNELQGEKIDVIQWSKDDAVFLAHALSPAQPLRVELDAEEQTATVIVPDRSLSLAIGREGQNARLAAKLTGWKVDIKSSTEVEIERMKRQIEGDVAERETAAEPATAEAAAETATAEAVAEPAAAEAPATPEAPAEAPSEDAAIMAELEAEAATVEPPAEPEAAPALSAEEMLALESLDIQAPDEVEEIIVEEEAVPEADADAAVWKTPEPVGGGTAIRFAEDILGGPSRNRRTGTRRRSSRGPARGPFRGPNRGAPPGGARPPSSGGGPSGAGGRPGA